MFWGVQVCSPRVKQQPLAILVPNSTNIQNANYESVIVAWLTAITFFQKGVFLYEECIGAQ